MRYKTSQWKGYLLLSILLVMGACSNKSKTIKVACIGDSITYGHGIDDQGNQSYPAKLGKLLGDNYIVENFGVCGATCLKKGDLSYWDQPEFEKALGFKPDIAIILLGTNDSKSDNWVYQGEYSSDYLSLISKFESLESKPQIWICNPPPAFESRWGINDSVISSSIIPKIEEIAKQENIPVIDFNTTFSEKRECFPDMIHPDTCGTSLMANKVAGILLNNGAIGIIN